MLGRRCSCRVRVQRQGHLPGQFFQLLNVLFCNRTADTGHRLFRPVLVGDNRVYISLDDNNLLCLLDSVSSHIQGIQDAILLKQQRLRRIQVLWLSITKGTSTETDDSTAHIPDGKDQAMPEVIIQSAATISYPLVPPTCK